MVIRWIKEAWREVKLDTIKRCFVKCGFPSSEVEATPPEEVDEEFERLFEEIAPECTIDEFIDVDQHLATGKEADTTQIDWREKLREECINEVANPQDDLQEEESDDDENEVLEEKKYSVKEILAMMDEVHHFTDSLGEAALKYNVEETIKCLEKLSLETKKQASIKQFFVSSV